jgi:hypothetical protein
MKRRERQLQDRVTGLPDFVILGFWDFGKLNDEMGK